MQAALVVASITITSIAEAPYIDTTMWFASKRRQAGMQSPGLVRTSNAQGSQKATHLCRRRCHSNSFRRSCRPPARLRLQRLP